MKPGVAQSGQSTALGRREPLVQIQPPGPIQDVICGDGITTRASPVDGAQPRGGSMWCRHQRCTE